jgi:hypothetical protein
MSPTHVGAGAGALVIVASVVGVGCIVDIVVLSNTTFVIVLVMCTVD